MMTLIINIVLVLGLLAFSWFSKRYVVSLLFLAGVMILEVVEHGMGNSWFLVLCEVICALFVVQETQMRKESSVLLKYNPLFHGNVLPRRVQFVVCVLFTIALLLRLVGLFVHRAAEADAREKGGGADYQQKVGSFVGRIIDAYKNNEEYQAIVRSNPYTNDIFVTRFVTTLGQEYARLDQLKHEMAAKPQERKRLIRQCEQESRNVVIRINAAGIGDANAKKMSKEFHDYYETLCSSLKKDLQDLNDFTKKLEGD